MQVKLKTGRVGDRFTQSVGDVITVGDAEGERMIQAGQAVLIDSSDGKNSGKARS